MSRNQTSRDQLCGNCKYFNVTGKSLLKLTGSNGGNTIASSQGGDAVINIVANGEIRIEDKLQLEMLYKKQFRWNMNCYLEEFLKMKFIEL